MKTREEIEAQIKKLKDRIYILRQEEDYEFVDNSNDISHYESMINILNWVLNKNK